MGPLRRYRVATFAGRRATGTLFVTAYTKWFTEHWPGCVIFEGIFASRHRNAERSACALRHLLELGHKLSADAATVFSIILDAGKLGATDEGIVEETGWSVQRHFLAIGELVGCQAIAHSLPHHRGPWIAVPRRKFSPDKTEGSMPEQDQKGGGA